MKENSMFHLTVHPAMRRFIIWFWFIPLGVFLFRCGIILCHNFKLHADFQDNGKNEQYAQKIPPEKMDFSQYNQYFLENTALIHPRYNVYVTLPKPIRYYTSPDDPSPALKLSKGCIVTVLPTNGGFSELRGYGLISYPTYQKGWRYVAPFRTGAEELNPNLLNAYTLKSYYVKAEDLETVMRAFYDQNKGMQVSAEQAGMSKQEYICHVTYKVDRVFYQNGVFMSPDLYRPLLDWASWILISVFLIPFGIWLWQRWFIRRKLS